MNEVIGCFLSLRRHSHQQGLDMTQDTGLTERRADKRLASDVEIGAVVVDRFSRPIESVRGARMVNVSAGGLAFTAESLVPAGATLEVLARGGASQPFRVKAVSCGLVDEATHVVRCRLVEGRVPAGLIYGW